MSEAIKLFELVLEQFEPNTKDQEYLITAINDYVESHYSEPQERKPLSEGEIRYCAESENLDYFRYKEEYDAFARAIEKAHGIGVSND